MARNRRGEELTRWSPLHELEDLAERFNRMLTAFPRFGEELPVTGHWMPRADVTETDDEFLISAELPGVRKEDVSVSVEEGRVVLRGERREERTEEGRTTHRVERSFGSFYRSFDLPTNVDETQVSAEYHDGILDVHLPKTRKGEGATRTIEIR